MSEGPQTVFSPDAAPGSTFPESDLESFVRAHLRGFALNEITESTIGLLTASAFLAGAAEILCDPDQGRDADTGPSALVARLFGLESTNAAGLVAAVGRLRARYHYMDDAHQAGLKAARQWRGGQPVSAAGLRELVRNSHKLSLIDLGQFGIKEAGQTGATCMPAPPSGGRSAPGRRLRVLFWLAAAVLAVMINACVLWLLSRS